MPPRKGPPAPADPNAGTWQDMTAASPPKMAGGGGSSLTPRARTTPPMSPPPPRTAAVSTGSSSLSNAALVITPKAAVIVPKSSEGQGIGPGGNSRWRLRSSGVESQSFRDEGLPWCYCGSCRCFDCRHATC